MLANIPQRKQKECMCYIIQIKLTFQATVIDRVAYQHDQQQSQQGHADEWIATTDSKSIYLLVYNLCVVCPKKS